MTDHQFFTARPSCADPPPTKDRIAIMFGDAPRRNADGSTTRSLRFPALIVSGWVAEPEEFAAMVAEILDANAHRFSDRAAQTAAAQVDPDGHPLHVHHTGCISYQGTAEDFTAWGLSAPARMIGEAGND